MHEHGCKEFIFQSYNTSTFNAICFDENPFACHFASMKKKTKRLEFQISQFYWSFSSDIMAAKGLRYLYLAEHNTYFQRTEREAFSKHNTYFQRTEREAFSKHNTYFQRTEREAFSKHNTYFQRTEREAFSKHKSRTAISMAYLLQNGYNRGFALLQVVQHHQDVAIGWQTSSRCISNVTHLKPRVAHFWNKQTFDWGNKTQSSTFLTLVALWNKQTFDRCNKTQSSTFLTLVALWNKQTFDRRNKTQRSTFLTWVALQNKQTFNSCNKVQSNTFLTWVTLRHK